MYSDLSQTDGTDRGWLRQSGGPAIGSATGPALARCDSFFCDALKSTRYASMQRPGCRNDGAACLHRDWAWLPMFAHH